MRKDVNNYEKRSYNWCSFHNSKGQIKEQNRDNKTKGGESDLK